MPTPERREGANGVSWRVWWRPGGRGSRKESVTFNETDYPRGEAKRLANRAAKLVDAHARNIDRDRVYRTVLGLPDPEPEEDLGPTMDQWFFEWAGRKVSVEQGTLNRYRSQWRMRISPALGNRRVSEIGHAEIANLVAEISSDRAPATVHRYHALLHQVLSAAVNVGIIPSNPASGTGLPRIHYGRTREQRVFLTHQEADLLLSAFHNATARDLVEVLLGTGMRYSEATALQSGDLDRSSSPARVRVERAWKKQGKAWVLGAPEPDPEEVEEMQAEGQWQFGAPKSERSRRTITVEPEIMAILERHADFSDPDSLVLTNLAGGRLDHSNFMRDHWNPAIAVASGWDKKGRPVPRTGGLLTKSPTPHSCRHTHAAWLLTAGVPVVRVSRRLGHDSVTTTDRFYGHLLPSDDDDILGTLRQARRRDEAAW